MERPTDDALLTALRLNDDHSRGLTKLDQQLAYVPLGALAAAAYAAASNRIRLPADGSVVALVVVLIAIGALVLLGLGRNQYRHRELLTYGDVLSASLGLPPRPPRKVALRQGRLIYGAMFGLAWTLGVSLLVILVSPA